MANNYPPYGQSTEKNDFKNFPSAASAISKCQIYFYKAVARPISNWQILWQFRNRLRRFIKRRLRYIRYFLQKLIRPNFVNSSEHLELQKEHLQAGDLVRVRSRKEIQAALNEWGELNGCGFMDEMWAYCDTTQVVKKRVEKFLDESTYRMHKSNRIVLLDGLICGGTVDFGRCDRSCFYFWREEWLQKIEQESVKGIV